jgi:2-amino-4-hydroxy-6-hydroxymethyldihydropteridine diphosphokinase
VRVFEILQDGSNNTDNTGGCAIKKTVFIALGTNLGDRGSNLRAAIAAFPPQVQVVSESRIYETAPWGYREQPDFLNQVVHAETDLPPSALLAYLKAIEEQIGREPTFRYGPRIVDLDILFIEDCIINQVDLSIPHPRLHERAFVLVPLADLVPDFLHPILGCTVGDLLAEIGNDGVVEFRDG